MSATNNLFPQMAAIKWLDLGAAAKAEEILYGASSLWFYDLMTRQLDLDPVEEWDVDSEPDEESDDEELEDEE